MVLFVVLCLTGFPQKFYTHRWAVVLVELLGGIGWTRRIHHLAGYTLAAMTIVHFGAGLAGMLSRQIGLLDDAHPEGLRGRLPAAPLLPGQGPARAALRPVHYKEKFEYWGLVMGNVVMVVTGSILLFPIQVTLFLPGVLVPAAKMAHSNEGLMAFLVITIWHIFNVHLNPDAFPFDPPSSPARSPASATCTSTRWSWRAWRADRRPASAIRSREVGPRPVARSRHDRALPGRERGPRRLLPERLALGGGAGGPRRRSAAAGAGSRGGACPPWWRWRWCRSWV